MTVMLECAEKWGKLGQEGRHQNALFYAENGMVATPDPRWLQDAFSILVDLFDRVGLYTNAGKTVVIVYRPRQVAGTQSEAAYR